MLLEMLRWELQPRYDSVLSYTVTDEDLLVIIEYYGGKSAFQPSLGSLL